MSDPIRFLHSFAQAVATLTLYREGHPARERAIDGAYRELRDLQSERPRLLFTFLEDEVVFGKEPLRELKAWDWGPRLAAAGVQRLEFDEDVSRSEFEAFLEDVLARLALTAVETAANRQMSSTRIKFGSVGVRGEDEASADPIEATVSYSLKEEAETIRWMHSEVQSARPVPLIEAEAIVRSLSLAMHSDQQILLPLLRLRSFDEYTTTHSLNVSVLAMALAEFIGLGSRQVRAFGVAGLLHDIGKVRIPKSILTKPGKLTDEERQIMNRHTNDGAAIILETERNLELPAVVAYEHHIMIDGGGYPSLHFKRDCHIASKLVHICDVYDALRTDRPYRDAWASEKVLSYLEEKGGTEFDPEFASAFVTMVRQWEPRFAEVDDEATELALPG